MAMVDCEGHLRAGVAVQLLLVAVVTVGYAGGVVRLGVVAMTALVFPVTVAGALFPDLDHHASLPYRYGRWVLPPLLGALVVVVGVRYWDAIAAALGGGQQPVPAGFLSGVLVASFGWATCIVGYAAFPVLRPPHRTITHRVSTGVVVAVCVGGVVGLVIGGRGLSTTGDQMAVVWASGAFLVGFLSHLAMDGPFSN